MSKARRLDENKEVDFTWVANMSLKFQGCYHTQQWNDETNGDEDVRISTQRLVRIGLEEYLKAYFESVQQDQEYSCE